MTPQEWIEDNNKLLTLVNDAKFMLPIIQGTHNSQIERLFDKGIAGDGDKIGEYSKEKPGIYINPKYNIGSFEGEGKTGEKKFKNGESHKTKYFDNYKGYREEIQKETSFVNLRLTENFKIDYTNSLRFAGSSVTTSVNSAINVKKYEGAVDKYGKRTFELTKEEQEKLSEKFGLAVIKQMRKN